MKQIIDKFYYGIMTAAIVLVLPLVADSASWDCQDDRVDLRQPGTLAMQNMQNEMVMHMRQGMPLFPPVRMIPPPPFLIGEKSLSPDLLGLDLTESQQDKVFELLYSQEPAMRAQVKVTRKVTIEIYRLTAKNQYSAAEVHRLANKLAEAIADTVVLRTETEARIHELLTPEQRKHVDEVRARCEADLAHEGQAPQ